MNKSKSNGGAAILVRMPAALRQKLEKMAAEERRTLSAQTCLLIERGLKGTKQSTAS